MLGRQPINGLGLRVMMLNLEANKTSDTGDRARHSVARYVCSHRPAKDPGLVRTGKQCEIERVIRQRMALIDIDSDAR